MAVNQQPLQRSITLPTTQVSTGSALSQLSNATSQISDLVTNRINDVLIDKAATQGAADVQEGKQPKNLAFPFTKATKAYNTAVTNTEASRLVNTAQNLINESLVTHKNTATFTRDTPAKFHAELEGIKSGILEQARDENREVIREHIDKLAANASINMLQHSINFDNEQTKFEFQKDITGLLEQRRNAAVEGDLERMVGIDKAIDQTLNDYSVMNNEIKKVSPYLRNDIESHKIVDTAITGYMNAHANGSESFYLKDLAENKQGLPYNVWQDAVKGVVALDQTQKRLSNDVNAIQWAQVQLGITNGSIQNAADIMNYNELSIPQQLTAMRQLDVAQAKELKQNSGLIDAQQNILKGRPTWNGTDVRNKMFKTQIQNFEAQTGQVATLVDMSQSVLGINDFPASGMHRTPIGANVPAFDSVVSQKLTSGDPLQTAQAAMVYNDMVNTKGMPQSLKVTGDALAVASLFDEIKQGGTSPEQAATLAINTVLNASEPEVAARIDRFHKNYENQDSNGVNQLQTKYKQMFGVDPQTFGADQSFKLFSDKFRSYYLSSNSEEAALAAVKHDMLPYGKSKYFDKGFVGQPVPEKEIPITNVAHSFDNQIVTNLQYFINKTNAVREAHPELNIPKVEWADPKQTLTGKETDQERVFKKFTIGDKPRLKIDGHETDVVLMPSASSRLDNGFNYLFGVYDRFNNLSPLRDVTNGADQVARFSPMELSLWSPSVANKKTDDALREVAARVVSQEKQTGDDELKEITDKNPPLLVMLGLSSPDKYREYIDKRQSNTNEGRLNQIVEALKGTPNSEATREAITEATNVGVSDDSDGMLVPGNIDLDNRPVVRDQKDKREYSTVSTATFGIDESGDENGKTVLLPTIVNGKRVSEKEAFNHFKETGEHMGIFSTRAAADKFDEQLHQDKGWIGERNKWPGAEESKNSEPEVEEEEQVGESMVNEVPEIKEPPPKLSDETISMRQVERETDRTDKRESRGKAVKDFKSNIELIFPNVGEKEISKVLSTIDFEKGNLKNQIMKAVNFLSSSNDKPTKPTNDEKLNNNRFNFKVEDIEKASHKNAPLLKKTIEDIRNLEGSVNAKVVSQVQKLYPHLNKQQSKAVVENFYYILNRKKLSEET